MAFFDENPYCAEGDLSDDVRSSLYIYATRAKTHVHEDISVPCEVCLMDIMAVGRYGFAMLNLIEQQQQKIKEQSDELSYWSNR